MLPEGGDFQITVAFGKPAACGIRKQRNVAEGRRRKIQQAVKIKLHRCGAEQIASTYYLIYAHERIVDDNSQLVGVHSVAAAQDKVTAFVRQVGLLPAVVHIRKGDKLVGNFDAPGGTALLHFGAALCCRQLAAAQHK